MEGGGHRPPWCPCVILNQRTRWIVQMEPALDTRAIPDTFYMRLESPNRAAVLDEAATSIIARSCQGGIVQSACYKVSAVVTRLYRSLTRVFRIVGLGSGLHRSTSIENDMRDGWLPSW